MKVEHLKNGKVAIEMTKEEYVKKFLSDEPEQLDPPEKTLEQAVTNELNAYGIRCNLKGFNYLREAITMVVKDERVIHSITRVLYPTIAQNHNDTPSRVERAIRHAIESARNIDRIIDHFSISPCNSEFIAYVAETMRLEGERWTVFG